jgi:hypothetical protein
VQNPDAEDGLWKVGDRRQRIYAKAGLSPEERLRATRKLLEVERDGSQEGQ